MRGPPGRDTFGKALGKVMGWALVLTMVVAAGTLVYNFVSGDQGDNSTESALDQRTCEIFRDIAADVDIDTPARTLERLHDLYTGYGEAASADISSALRDVVAALNANDLDRATVAVGATDSACTAHGA